MNPSIWLRVAAVITLLYWAGHMSGMPWTPGVGAGPTQVVDGMRSQQFTDVGPVRTYWDFYQGFGVAIGIFHFAIAILLWQLAGLARADARCVRPLIATLFLAFVANAIVVWMYIFMVPALFAVAAAMALAMALVTPIRPAARPSAA
jgi:hypothetical protein